MSHLAWIDFDRDAERAAREMVQQMNMPEARDELGLGTVRDGLADLLFPGTSTIQTRVHYMLFIPWIWQIAARERTLDARMKCARELEFTLCEALGASDDTDGIIGRVAGRNLKRLPSSVYWSGLGKWEIRCDADKSPERILREAPRDGLWDGGLIETPDNFPDEASFTLRKDDADFLRGRIAGIKDGSALADLSAYSASGGSLGNNLLDIDEAAFSAENRRLLLLADTFAQVMQGARLLYNLIAAQKLEQRTVECPGTLSHDKAAEWAEWYAARLREWAEKVDFDALDPEAVYTAVRRTDRIPNVQLKNFVRDWIDVARRKPKHVAENDAARALIVQREYCIKPRKTARLSTPAALDRWGGASGAYKLDYRWGTARQFLTDLSHAG